jgi:hypothetical protein
LVFFVKRLNLLISRTKKRAKRGVLKPQSRDFQSFFSGADESKKAKKRAGICADLLSASKARAGL